VRYGSIGGLQYEVPQSRLYCLCINVALCSTASQCICRVIRRSSMTMKAHTYYIIFGRPPIGGGVSSPSPWRRHWYRIAFGCRGRFGANDSSGGRAAPVTLIVQLCNCSQHGDCVWDQLKDGFTHNLTFQLVACDCNPLYHGQ